MAEVTVERAAECPMSEGTAEYWRPVWRAWRLSPRHSGTHGPKARRMPSTLPLRVAEKQLMPGCLRRVNATGNVLGNVLGRLHTVEVRAAATC